MLSNPNIWNNPSNAEKLTKQMNVLKEMINPVMKLKSNIDILKQYEEFNENELDLWT